MKSNQGCSNMYHWRNYFILSSKQNTTVKYYLVQNLILSGSEAQSSEVSHFAKIPKSFASLYKSRVCQASPSFLLSTFSNEVFPSLEKIFSPQLGLILHTISSMTEKHLSKKCTVSNPLQVCMNLSLNYYSQLQKGLPFFLTQA